MSEQDILEALKEAYRRAGTQSALAEKAGISQGRIADYLSGRYAIGNMTVATLLKLFPDMKMDFFGGNSESEEQNAIKDQIMEIFNSLDIRGKTKMLAMVAANFGDKLREETKK